MWAFLRSIEKTVAVYQPPAVAEWPGKPGEWLYVRAGFVLLVQSPALRVGGVLRLDGVVKVACV